MQVRGLVGVHLGSYGTLASVPLAQLAEKQFQLEDEHLLSRLASSEVLWSQPAAVSAAQAVWRSLVVICTY